MTAQLVAILHHEGIKVASNLAKTRLQVELKEHVCRLAIKPAGIRFEKRIDVRACPITGIACDRVPYHMHALVQFGAHTGRQLWQSRVNGNARRLTYHPRYQVQWFSLGFTAELVFDFIIITF